MSEFLAAEDAALLQRHGLAGFEALWSLQLDAVDEPNTRRGGWSTVYRLQLGEQAYFLKRQCNYLTHDLFHPQGEPTFAREFRNIQRYRALGIPALSAAFFSERKHGSEWQAILLTRALDDWQDLDSWLVSWPELPEVTRQNILYSVGELARTLHAAGLMHGCFYPKHVFLQERGEGFAARLIDLEKTRRLFFGSKDRVKDLEPLLRRVPEWSEAEVRLFLACYLQAEPESRQVSTWLQRLGSRRRYKESRA
ncbi:tRNA A-37 threonylcarbamoyl transferase component Bud32 [Pseudomonas duriflava]|uniref:tRNA A-37 threonylcarbamoyl transferase component Bud32 n=1 Tax=Pseudomonas duriflava TaxID=459528 RepID=A0A562QBS1_9PSED|nr:lipopolysaccharide kinase InaA family protein [Pseudomonas duriflava]TWI54201.1 tRNA A-37 threonylcarbamoyl transferase component Bud32 [Pseudomonas duriflava]